MSVTPQTVTRGRFYRFKNKKTEKMLNFYKAGGGTNVNSYRKDGTRDQIWLLKSDDKLYPENYSLDLDDVTAPFKCLTRSTSSATLNSAIVSEPTDDVNQVVSFISTETTTAGVCGYITLANKINGSTYYLKDTGSDVVWTSSLSSDGSCIWQAEELRKKTITFEPTEKKEYFSCWGFSRTSFFTSALDSKIAEFYDKCFKAAEKGIPNTSSRRNYNLFGALYEGKSSSSQYDGKFHTGIDFDPGAGRKVYAPFAGTIVGKTSNYGTVVIEANGVKYYFLHMTGLAPNKSVNQTIQVGEEIGTVSNIVSGGAASSSMKAHLHIEVQSANSTRDTGLPYEENTYECSPYLLSIYDYI